MTKEQALKILRQPDRIGCSLMKSNDEESCEYNQESIEALNMAIKALEQQSNEDCVSRQAVLDTLMKCEKPCDDRQDFYLDSTTEFEGEIKGLPPVISTFPKGATNGDMVKAMFPEYTVQINYICEDVYVYYEGTEGYTGSWVRFDLNWWNTPYKRGGEE